MFSPTENEGVEILPGAALCRERERQGLRVEDIASLASIPVQFVRAIEENRFTDLPPSVEPLNFVRSYACALGCEPDPWIEQFQKVLPRQRPMRRLRQGASLLDDRRAIMYKRLIVAAVVVVLWLLYSLVVHTVFRSDRDNSNPDSEAISVQEIRDDAPARDR